MKEAAVSKREASKVGAIKNGEDLLGYEDSDLIQLVTFNLVAEEFAFNILNIQEIIRIVPITRVPNVPSFVEGVINLRGKVIPVVDMRKRFKILPIEPTSDTRIMVMQFKLQVVGFVLDAVSEVLRLPLSCIEAAPSLVAGVGAEYMDGVGKLEDRLLLMLNLEKLLESKELEELSTQTL